MKKKVNKVIVKKESSYQQKSLMMQQVNELMKTDGFTNVLTGYGSKMSDRKEQFDIRPDMRLSYLSRQSLYKDSALTANIIDCLVEDALKDFFIIKHEKSTDLTDFLQSEEINIYSWIERAWKTARENNGSIIIFNINDGQDPVLPVNYEKIKSVEPLFIIQSDFIQPISKDPINPLVPIGYWVKGSVPEWYTISSEQVSGVTYHKSRVMIFNGKYSGENNSIETNGFGESEIDLNRRSILLYELVFGSVSTLADSAIQEIIKLEGISSLLENDQDETVLKKIISVMMGKSILKKLVMDKNDEFQYHSANFSGYKELGEMARENVSMSSKIPLTRLFGSSPSASLGSQTGGYEENLWFTQIENSQNKILLPNLIKLINWIKPLFSIKQNELIKLGFKPLKTIDPKTKVEIEKIEADTLETYLKNDILSLEEVRNIVTKKYGIKI